MGNDIIGVSPPVDGTYPGYIVYRYTNTVNGKMYVGITKQGSLKRRVRGRHRGYKGCSHLYSAIEKYGWDSFAKEIIAYGLTKEEAESLEIDLVALYDLTNPKNGYNIQRGGISAGGLSDEGRQRLSEINTGALSPVARSVVAFTCDGKKIREFDCIRDAEKMYGIRSLCKDLKPGTHTRKGMIFRLKEDVGDITQLPSDECKRPYDFSGFVGSNAHHVNSVVLFDKHTGKRVAEFGCAKDASEFVGVNVTDCMRGVHKTCGDYICYRSEDVVGVDVLPNLNDHKPKSHGKRVLQYSLQGELIAEFQSARDAERATNVSHKIISNCVRGATHTGGGFIWRYSEE